jgi:hypothetical protein
MPEKYRIPLGGSYNTRLTETNALSSSSGIWGLGIWGVFVWGASIQSTDKDQRFINCWTKTVVNPYTYTKTLYCIKRPGFGVLNTPEAGSIGTAIMVWTGQGAGTKVMSAFGGTNSTLYDSTTSKGAISGKATQIAETFVSTTPMLIIPSTDSTAWYYDNAVTVAVATQITDADFPGNAGFTLAGGFASMDGYNFIMDTLGNVWNSDLNSVTAWTATNFLAANSYPDRGIGCIRQRDKLMAFGTESVQFFYNAGNPSGSPLSRIEQMTLRLGCCSADAITTIEDTVFWAGSSPQGGMHISMYGGGSGYKKISTPEIESILILAGASNISMTSTEIYGSSLVIVNASNVTFVYVVEEGSWHEWNTAASRLWYKMAGVSSGNTQVVYAISNTSTTGKVFTINPSALTYQDNGLAYTARIQLSKIGSGDRRIVWDEVNVIGDQNASSSTLTVSYTSDDYQNYTTLGTVDLANAQRKITRCGSDYRRAWVLTHSDNAPFRLEALTGVRTIQAI